MKKIFKILFTFALILTLSSEAKAMTFEEAFNQTNKTPMVVLIYAQWADGVTDVLQKYETVKRDFSGVFNFTSLDIASKDAKFFNSKFHIYPNLPYMLMFRDNGKVSRYIPQNCVSDVSCVKSKLKSFIQ